MRLFVAVWPPPTVVEQLVALERPSRPGLRWTTPDQWHVTLRFFGPIEDPEMVKDALGRLGHLAGAAAVMGPATKQLGRSVLSVPIAGLEETAARVASATARYGKPPPDRRFRGHITLARAKGGVDLRPLAATTLSGEWPVDELTLVASTLDPRGARYEILSRHALAGQTGVNVAW